MKRKLRACAVPAMLVAALALAGCSAGVTAATTAAAEAAASGKLSVVATTNVWGDIAESVGGDHVAVTALIDDPSIDPHEFQADARDQLAIAKANVVIENGGGYDDFAGTMLATVKNPKRVTLNAVDLSRTTQSLDGSINEHVWYDFPTVTRVVEALRGTLATLDPAHAAAYQANASALTTKLGALEASTADLKAKYAGKGAAITEPVPLYLLNAIGLVDKTPTKFSEAIENGSDVAPSVLRETLALFSNDQVAVLVYNEQTSGPQTSAVVAAAKQADVPAVGVTETLPAQDDYITWMRANIDAVSAALAHSAQHDSALSK